jgi:hypothetical protein
MSSNSSQPVVPVANNAPKRARSGTKCMRCNKMLYKNHQCNNRNAIAPIAGASVASSSSVMAAAPANVPVVAASAAQSSAIDVQNGAIQPVAELTIQESSVIVEEDDSDHEPEQEEVLINDPEDYERKQEEQNQVKVLLKQRGRNAKEIEWTMHQPHEMVVHDVRLENGGGNINAKINFAQATRDFHGIPNVPANQNARVHNLFHSYLLTSYPCDTVQQVCDATNRNLKAKNLNTVKLTPHLWFKFLGILLGMTLQDLPNRQAYWEVHETNDETKRLFAGPNFGRYMAKYHFDQIMANFCLIEPDAAAQVQQQDKWRAARPIVDGFNRRRKVVISAGQFITIDESMCPWQGQGDWNPINGCPRIIKIPRKPTPVGVEIKNLIDCQTKCLLFLEMQEGIESMALKQFGGGEDVQKSTGLVLRLTKEANLWGSKRVIIGDSAFASVITCYKLATLANLYCMGIVKTATSLAPAKAVNDRLRVKGDQVTFVGELDGVKLIAHGHMDKTKKMIVASCGRTIPGVAQKKPRSRYNEQTNKMESYFTVVERTELMAQYFSGSGDIDWHNRLRAFLALEQMWVTWSWWKRVFGTVFAMIVTDAYLMYVFDQKDQPNIELLSRQAFMETLAYEMIKNEIKDMPEGNFRQKRKQRSADIIEDVDEDELIIENESSENKCKYKPLRFHSEYKNANKIHYGRNCSVCRKKAYNYCDTCSRALAKLVPICSERVSHRNDTSCQDMHEARRRSQSS